MPDDVLPDDVIPDDVLPEEVISEDEGGSGLSSFRILILPPVLVSVPYFDLAVKDILPNEISSSYTAGNSIRPE